MDPPIETAAKQLAWEMESRQSVEVRVVTTIVNHKPDPLRKTVFDTIEEHYIETAAGQRFYDMRALGSGVVGSRSTHFGDGRKFTDVNYDPRYPDSQQSVYIKRQFWMEEGNDRRQMPHPVLLEYVGREPLYKALLKSEFIGTSEVIGRGCNAFVFKQVRWAVPQDQVFHLDRATSVPLKVEAFRDQAAREKKEPMWVWTAESLDQVEGHSVPLKSTQTAYAPDGTPQLTWNYHVKSVLFDRQYPTSTFQPVLQPGVTVMDEITGKIHQTPGARLPAPETPETTTTTVQPIQAAPPSDWSAIAPTIAMVLGALVLIVAGVLWRRGRG